MPESHSTDTTEPPSHKAATGPSVNQEYRREVTEIFFMLGIAFSESRLLDAEGRMTRQALREIKAGITRLEQRISTLGQRCREAETKVYHAKTAAPPSGKPKTS